MPGGVKATGRTILGMRSQWHRAPKVQDWLKPGMRMLSSSFSNHSSEVAGATNCLGWRVDLEPIRYILGAPMRSSRSFSGKVDRLLRHALSQMLISALVQEVTEYSVKSMLTTVDNASLMIEFQALRSFSVIPRIS